MGPQARRAGGQRAGRDQPGRALWSVLGVPTIILKFQEDVEERPAGGRCDISPLIWAALWGAGGLSLSSYPRRQPLCHG
jgi:hypothetical protein